MGGFPINFAIDDYRPGAPITGGAIGSAAAAAIADTTLFPVPGLGMVQAEYYVCRESGALPAGALVSVLCDGPDLKGSIGGQNVPLLPGLYWVEGIVDLSPSDVSATALAPLLWLGGHTADLVSDAKRRRLPWFDENRPAVRAVNSWQTLVGRTIIVEALR